MASEDALQDQPHRVVARVGGTVRRPAQPWTPTVHALLKHLEAVGFPYAPRPLGFDDQGREVLTFINGESGPQSWAKVVDDQGLSAYARLLREFHDATADFTPPDDAAWADGPIAPGEGQVICHGDFGPWNVVWQGNRPVGIIDWDFARPGARMHDVAYALQYVTPFRDDAECLRWLRYPAPPDRRRRLEQFCTAYGLTTTAGVVDAVIDRQQETIDLVRRLASQGHEPQTTWVREGLLEELGRRLAWSRSNRRLVA
ncbi:aminoglycoside phosphotransferase family protein [Streptomyces sp. A7024]|uniref:Aminoglycoside phosphotransferase family protein n=1 Tax=Streptomyces coryli TaxID=1128680 RepID=A0A6G4TY77_9ACTN|nr:aminoglycoside phosphotransferase family protein [Streptomyces coryli]NGN64773.1 aminoglycoside phosphotransferase family protein [Streptomyces coryli]